MLDSNIKYHSEKKKRKQIDYLTDEIEKNNTKIKAIEAFGALKDSPEWRAVEGWIASRLKGFIKTYNGLTEIDEKKYSTAIRTRNDIKASVIKGKIIEDKILLSLASSQRKAINIALNNKAKYEEELKNLNDSKRKSNQTAGETDKDKQDG